MCRKTSIHSASDRQYAHSLPPSDGIGQLFRDYGEEYIRIYDPALPQIKLIRSIRVCRTPALGGKVITCKDCGHKHYIYKSCGNSQCMLCQSIKREQWVDKLKNSLLAVPYVHIVFTLPHQLNGLARNNQKQIYGLILKAAWLTIKKIFNPLHCLPGMTSVLHTFGSDMKYHIHVHALVTFGGLSPQRHWIYPLHKHKIEKYRAICSSYKQIMIHQIERLCKNHKIQYHLDNEKILKEVKQLRWVVHSTRPAMDTLVIEEYLARYINRIAISNSRLSYVKQTQEVKILYNDYKHQQLGSAAPKIVKSVEPLVILNQILQHILPSHFPKSRSYGLHHASSTIKKSIPDAITRHDLTVRTIMEIIYHLCKIDPYTCEKCGSKNYAISILLQDKDWKEKFLSLSISSISNDARPPPIPAIILSSNYPIDSFDSLHSFAFKDQKILNLLPF